MDKLIWIVADVITYLCSIYYSFNGEYPKATYFLLLALYASHKLYTSHKLETNDA